MSDPKPSRESDGLPPEERMAADRELTETLFEEGISSAEKARRLFAHGLLKEQGELLRVDAAQRREARIQATLDRLGEPAPALDDLDLAGLSRLNRTHEDESERTSAPAPIRVAVWKRSHFRLLVSAVAALLLASLTLFWLVGERQSALPELLAMARENNSRGLHIYRGHVVMRRGTHKFDLALAEGGKVQIHVKTERGDFDVGSTGKMGWFKTPIGKAIEVPLWDLLPLLEALPENLRTLSPDLSYLEVEGLLAKILTEEGMRIVGRENEGRSDEWVVLEGHYRVKGRSPHGRRHRRARTDSTTRRIYTGTVKVRISPEQGWIHDIRFKDDQRKTETLLERVLSLPGEGEAERPAWVDFEPEFNKSVPSLRVMGFLGSFLRKLRANRKTEKSQGSEDRGSHEAGSGPKDGAVPEGPGGRGLRRPKKD